MPSARLPRRPGFAALPLVLAAAFLAAPPGDAADAVVDATAAEKAPDLSAPEKAGRVCDDAFLPATPEEAACALARGGLGALPVVPWTSLNDGEGSGLDADTLDGLSSGWFLEAIAAEALARRFGDDRLGLAREDEATLREDVVARLRAEYRGLADRGLAVDRLERAVDAQARDRAGSEATLRALVEDATARQDRALAASEAAFAETAARVEAGLAEERLLRATADGHLQRAIDEEAAARAEEDAKLDTRVADMEAWLADGKLRGETLDVAGEGIFGGGVGIGVGTPLAKLHVAGSILADAPEPVLILSESDVPDRNWWVTSENGRLGLKTVNDALTAWSPARFVLTQEGHVGIGISDPVSRLHVAGGDAVFGGRIGVGTTTPAHPLHVANGARGLLAVQDRDGKQLIVGGPGNPVNGGIVLTSITGPSGGVRLENDLGHFAVAFGDMTNEAGSRLFRILKDGRVGIGTESPAAALDVAGGSAVFRGRVGIGTASPQAPLHVQARGSGMIHLIEERSGDFTDAVSRGARIQGGASTGHGGSFTISTQDAVTGRMVPRVSVGATGNVGIATMVPRAELEVAGKVKAGRMFLGADTGGNPALFFNSAGILEDGWHVGHMQSVDGTLRITESGIADRVVITRGGNVGIGKTPGARLDVAGDVRASGTIEAGGRGYFASLYSSRDIVAEGDVVSGGHIYAHTSSHVGDVAEPAVGEGLAPGDVVVLDGFDAAGKARVKRADAPMSREVIGVVSTNPSIRLAGLATDLPLAVTGIVPVNVSGPWRRGTSSRRAKFPGGRRHASTPSRATGGRSGRRWRGSKRGRAWCGRWWWWGEASRLWMGLDSLALRTFLTETTETRRPRRKRSTRRPGRGGECPPSTAPC